MYLNEIKAAVSVPEAARYYGIKTKSNGMAKCPFHDDKTPSLKLYDRNYYCFGCGAHGDVIDLVGRLHNITTKEAARKIIADLGLDIPINGSLPPAERKNRIMKTNEALRSEKIYRAFSLALRELRLKLISCKRQLDGWKYSLAPADRDVPPEKWDRRFVTASIWSDYIDYLIDVIDFGENDERFEMFIRRKEVEAIAEGLIADSSADGRSRKRTPSGGLCYKETIA